MITITSGPSHPPSAPISDDPLMNPIEGDHLRGHLELLILVVLADQPAHGYEIANQLIQKSDGAFDIQEGSLYPALHRMEQAGLAKSRWQEGERGPRRREYSLTVRGRRELGAQRDDWRALVSAINGVVGETG